MPGFFFVVNINMTNKLYLYETLFSTLFLVQALRRAVKFTLTGDMKCFRRQCYIEISLGHHSIEKPHAWQFLHITVDDPVTKDDQSSKVIFLWPMGQSCYTGSTVYWFLFNSSSSVLGSAFFLTIISPYQDYSFYYQYIKNMYVCASIHM